MEMILSGVAVLKHDWRAWVVLGLVALKALFSVWMYFRCPYACGRRAPTTEEISAAKAYRFTAPQSFLLLMLAGIGLAIAGLYLLNNPERAPLALGLLVLGGFIFSSEPNRLAVKSAMTDVIATAGDPGEANLLARDSLKDAHRARAFVEVAIVAATAGLLFLL